MMIRATYKQIPTLISYFKPFTGNSVTGWIDGGQFVVMSYATVIAKIDMATHSVSYFNDKFYSRTTSKIQNILRRLFAL